MKSACRECLEVESLEQQALPSLRFLSRHVRRVLQFYVFDPRGYFGNLPTPYGLPQYDHAKIAFALSGYDLFDTMDIQELDIRDGNISIPLNPISWKKEILESMDEITRLFFISAWLGNAHSFAERNPAKAVCSYLYALYIATIFLD